MHKRIADVELAEPLIYTPKFSLTIVNDTSDYVPSSVLADRMLSSSDAVLTQACGVFVDDAFVGAVASNQEVEFALSERLADFNAPAGATDVQYENAVTFRSGMYLEDSLLDTEEMIEKLTASERYRSQYTVQQGESVVQVAKSFHGGVGAARAESGSGGGRVSGRRPADSHQDKQLSAHSVYGAYDPDQLH